jgi:RNA polymerase-binding transcription factor DksA
MTIDTKNFEERLKAELATLEKELATVGRKNPDQSADWEGVEPEMNLDKTEDGENAEGMEEFEKNNALVEQLETRLEEVEEALHKIQSGNYGKCETCGEEIEMDRLEANPAAKTCKSHMK